jgi:hypothetical protein
LSVLEKVAESVPVSHSRSPRRDATAPRPQASDGDCHAVGL